MAVFTLRGRVALAQALLNMDLYLAVGTGDPAWDSLPIPTSPEDIAAQDAAWATLTDLTDRVGVTKVRDKFFVMPDASGTIPMSDGSLFAQSMEPTPYIYLRFQLDLADAAGLTLRESGLFLGTQIAGTVPSGQMYIPSADVTDFGEMIQVDRFPAIVRDGTISQILSTVVTM